MPKNDTVIEELKAELQDEALPIDVGAAPAPKPGDADYNWAAEYGTADLFRYTFPAGEVVALRPFASIYSKTWMYKMRNAPTTTEVEFAALERGSCDAARQVLENLDDTAGDSDLIDDLVKAWLRNGTSNGEGDDGLTSGN